MGCREHSYTGFQIHGIIFLLIGGLITLSGCENIVEWNTSNPAIQPVAQAASHQPTAQDSNWVMSKEHALANARSVLDTLTLQEKIGQLFFIAAEGQFMHRQDEEFIELTEKIRTEHVGGILFFKGSIYGQTHLTNRLQKSSALPLWITQDMEFGAAMRVRGTTTITPAMGIAASGNPDLARQAGYITAMEARALGVHQIFAPVVDVNNNPRNPVINVRSFGGTADLVSRFSTSFIDGAKQGGVISTAKHFPGHGDTHVDSHVQLPIIDSEYRELKNLELIPFRSAIDAGIESIMSAHISFPNISGRSRLPATMDPEILNGILRDSLQFDGLVVTDALEMQGITDHYSPGEAALKSIQAGSDILLISPDATAAMHHIKTAVEDGRLSAGRIEESALKILMWKFRRGLFSERTIELDQLTRSINPPEYQVKAEQIARRSITVLANKLDILPLHSEDYPSICAVALADDKSGDTGTRLARALRRYHDNVRFHTYDRRSGEEEKARIRRCARQSDLLVIGSFIYVKTYQDISLNREQQSFIESLSRYQNPEVLISFGNPYIFDDIPHAEVDIQAWAPFNVQVDAASEALFGASPIAGSMPIRYPGHFERGDGLAFPQSAPSVAAGKTPYISASFSRDINRNMSKAISDSTFPGATLMIMDQGRMVYHHAFGYESFDKQNPIKLGSAYSLPALGTDLAGIPYLLADLQSRTSDPSPSKGDTKSGRMENLSTDITELFDSDAVTNDTIRWNHIAGYHDTRSSSSIEASLNRLVWRPLEMEKTRLEMNNIDSKRSNQPVPSIKTTTWDLNKLLFTLMNDGQYKDRQILHPSLTRKFTSQTNGASDHYRPIGSGASRIWLDRSQKRAVVLLIRSTDQQQNSRNDENIRQFRRELLERVHREVTRSHSVRDLNSDKKYSS